MRWTGNQDGGGFELRDYRDEAFAALPPFTSPDDDGRKIWVTTAGADYGPWVGNEDAGDWARPGSFGGGGGGGGYSEPGMVCWVEPFPLAEWGAGFSPFEPVVLYTRRPIDILDTESILLQQQYAADALGTPALMMPAIDVGGGSFAWGDLYATIVWFDISPFGLGAISILGSSYFQARLVVLDASGQFADGITIMIQAAPTGPM